MILTCWKYFLITQKSVINKNTINLGACKGEVTLRRPLFFEGKSKAGEKQWKVASFNGSEMRTVSTNVLLIFQGFAALVSCCATDREALTAFNLLRDLSAEERSLLEELQSLTDEAFSQKHLRATLQRGGSLEKQIAGVQRAFVKAFTNSAETKYNLNFPNFQTLCTSKNHNQRQQGAPTHSHPNIESVASEEKNVLGLTF